MFKLEKRYKLQDKELLGEGQPAGDSELEGEKLPESVPYAEFLALQESNKKMGQHMETLLGEKKAEKARRQEAERLAEQEALDKSKQANNLEEFERQITSQFETKETGYKSKIDKTGSARRIQDVFRWPPQRVWVANKGRRGNQRQGKHRCRIWIYGCSIR